jgi:Xaa-Pro aminopeptidase/Xaa-Pro dipeptidase
MNLDSIIAGLGKLQSKIAPSDRRAKFTNKARISNLLRKTDMAAILAASPENVPYFSGYYNFDLALLREHTHIAIWPAEGDPILVARPLGPGRQPLDPFVQDIRVYGRGITPMQLLADVITEKGWSKSQLGIERAFFSLARYEELSQLLPDVQFVDCRHLIDEIKMIKTPAEIEHLRWAARATNKAIHIAYELTRPGDTEKSVADMMGFAITKLGADQVAFNVLAAGARTVLGHHYAEDIPLKKGDIMRVDYGGLFSGYYTDMIRMAVVGDPSERQRSTYHKVVEVHQDMLDGVKPGAIPHKLSVKALKKYQTLGLPPTRTFFGHSIGLSVHELPDINLNVERQLEPNMVLCIENAWSDEALRERYYVEDMILVTENGFDLLTNYTSIEEMYVIL